LPVAAAIPCRRAAKPTMARSVFDVRRTSSLVVLLDAPLRPPWPATGGKLRQRPANVLFQSPFSRGRAFSALDFKRSFDILVLNVSLKPPFRPGRSADEPS
jgi:hypothetical protein